MIHDSLFAVLLRSPEMLILNVLAAAGGALIGALGTALITVVLFKLVRVKRVPRRAVGFLATLGGVVLGWAVWMWVSGIGGYGPGPGGGVAGGTGGTGSSTAASTPGATVPASARAPVDSLRIVVVRSKDYEADSKRYYLVEGKAPAQTLAETLRLIKERQQQNPALKTIEVVIYQDSIAEARGVVADLEDPVRPLGLTVKTSKPGTDTP